MRPKSISLALLIPILLTGACASGLPPHIAARFAQATLTPTPFLPEGMMVAFDNDGQDAQTAQTSYALASPGESPWGDFPAPSVASDLAIPPPVEALEQAEGQLNILILGSDQRPDDGGFRTDVVLLLSVNPDDGRASLISFPRDLYVYQPGWGMDRINTAQARGGFELIALTFEYNFGVRPDHWVLVNFEGFRDIITALDGIDVEVQQALSDQRDGYGEYSVESGNLRMDAETALWYVRSRGSSDDFDRTRRQQEVIRAIFFRSLSLDILKQAPELYAAYKQMLQTDLSFADMLPLFSLPGQIKDGAGIQGFIIGPNQAAPWVSSSGALVLLPDRDAIRQVLLSALDG